MVTLPGLNGLAQPSGFTNENFSIAAAGNTAIDVILKEVYDSTYVVSLDPSAASSPLSTSRPHSSLMDYRGSKHRNTMGPFTVSIAQFKLTPLYMCLTTSQTSHFHKIVYYSLPTRGGSQ